MGAGHWAPCWSLLKAWISTTKTIQVPTPTTHTSSIQISLTPRDHLLITIIELNNSSNTHNHNNNLKNISRIVDIIKDISSSRISRMWIHPYTEFSNIYEYIQNLNKRWVQKRIGSENWLLWSLAYERTSNSTAWVLKIQTVPLSIRPFCVLLSKFIIVNVLSRTLKERLIS